MSIHLKVEPFTLEELDGKTITLLGKGFMFTLMSERANLSLGMIPSFIQMHNGSEFYGYYDFNTNVFSWISKDDYNDYTKKFKRSHRNYTKCREDIYLLLFAETSFVETFDFENRAFSKAFGNGTQMQSRVKP